MAIALTDVFQMLTNAVEKGLTAEEILSAFARDSVEKGLLNQQELERLMGGHGSVGVPSCAKCCNSKVREDYTNCRICKVQHHKQCGFADGFCSKRCRAVAKSASAAGNGAAIQSAASASIP